MAVEHARAQHEPDAAAAAKSQALDDIQARIGRYFQRREMRQRVQRYLFGVLGHVERRNNWQLAEALCLFAIWPFRDVA